MKQIGTQKFVSDDNKFIIICENDLSLGVIHDYLLQMKGTVVEMITNAQKQEQEATDAVRAKDAEKPPILTNDEVADKVKEEDAVVVE